MSREFTGGTAVLYFAQSSMFSLTDYIISFCVTSAGRRMRGGGGGERRGEKRVNQQTELLEKSTEIRNPV